MFDDREKQVLTDLFGSDTPMYMHRLADYAAMFATPGDGANPDTRRSRAEVFLRKLGVFDDVIARDSSERPYQTVPTAILGVDAWSTNASGGQVTRIAPAPDPNEGRAIAGACKAGGDHAFRVTCAKCGEAPSDAHPPIDD